MSTKEIFYSYAHTDEALRNELDKHLSLLKRQGLIAAWHDRMIDSGEEWDPEIRAALQRADIILLLVSADFNNSNYIWNVELSESLKRHEEGNARVIPIILRPCDWHSAPYGKLQALPTDGKPVTTWANQDEAWLNIVEGLRRVI